jgi:FAD/FMN-containing dehydrogenase
MIASVANYDGSLRARPQRLVRVKDVDELCTIVRDKDRYPGPVRAMGSNHSLTPCASSDGTIVDMTGLNRIVEIDSERMTITAQAGLQWIDAAKALRARNLQFINNVEIGNLTMGAAACCHTKDGLDGFGSGQISSHVVRLKWVTPSGSIAEVSRDSAPDLLHMMRSSHGLCGIIYEATFEAKPLEAIRFKYLPRPIRALTERQVDDIIASAQGLVCWTVGETAVFQIRTRADKPSPLGSTFANIRRRVWSRSAAHAGRFIDVHAPGPAFKSVCHDAQFAAYRATYSILSRTGSSALANPDKIVDYRQSPPSSRYAFTYWAFPSGQWLGALNDYLVFAEQHFRKYGFRCNMPLGSYYIREDASGILSYTNDGATFSIDPIHAWSNQASWERFLREFNEFAYKRNGIPLLNQTPFVKRKHLIAAYGARWRRFSDWVRAADPDGRLLNAFFAELLE